MRLRTRFTLLLLAAAIPAPLLAALFSSQYAISGLNELASRQLRDAGTVVSTRLEGWDKRMATAIGTVAQNLDVQSMDPKRQVPILQGLSAVFPELTLIATVDLKGANIARHDGQPLKDYSDREWFHGARQGRIAHQLIISRTTGKPAIAMGGPIRDEKGTIVGVAVVGMNLDALTRATTSQRTGRTGYVLVLDRTGRLVTQDAPAEGEGITVPADLASLASLTPHSDSQSIDFKDSTGRQWRASLSPATEDWCVVSLQSADEFNRATRRFILAVSISLSLAGLFVVLGTTWIVRKLLRPIEDVRTAAVDLARGALDRRVPEGSNDELGALARAFNRMANDLGASYAAVQQSRDHLEQRVQERTAELQKLNVEIVQAQMRFASVVDHSLNGISVFESIRDADGKIVDFRWMLANEACAKMLSTTPDQLLGRSLLTLYPGIKTSGLFDRYLEVIATGVPMHIEQHYQYEQFDTWFELVAVRQHDGISLTFADISIRKSIEAQLVRAKDAADAASRAKSEFLANMSHEIRTPMTAILGFADMLLDPSQTQSDRVDGLMTIRRNAQHLLELINNVLDVSKIEAGRMSVEQMSCDVPALLADVASMLEPRAREKNVPLKLTLETPIPLTASTDSLRVRQILMNLIGNAIKFTPAGQIELRVALLESPASPTLLRFSVIDSGLGMNSEQLSQIFTPFMQADGSTTRRYGGTGLGLTISQRLAQLLGGNIAVCSEPGVGSTFTATVAAGQVSAERVEQIDPALLRAREPRGAERQLPPLHGKILLAEDGKDNQRLVATILRRAGAEVMIADNGRIAIELATQHKFDLIFMDMQMPEVDGYHATAELRRLGSTLPIIALTAHAMADDRDKCLAAGCTNYLTKPIDRVKLLQLAATYLTQDREPQLPLTPEPAPRLVSKYRDDADMKTVLKEFVDQLPETVSELCRCRVADDLPALKRVLHQLKGAGGSYGFDFLTESAAGIEVLIQAARPIDLIHSELHAMIAIIRQIEGYDSAAESRSLAASVV